MELRIQDWVTNILGVQSVAQFGAQQVHTQDVDLEGTALDCSPYFDISVGGGLSSIVQVKENLAVIPEDWSGGNIKSSWINVRSANSQFIGCLAQMKQASFISLSDDFTSLLGSAPSMEVVLPFDGPDANHVHEAPVFVPETNELIFADTSVQGWLWALNVDSYLTRKIRTNPPLRNVNGGTLHKSKMLLTTNGGTAPAVHSCSVPTKSKASGEDETIDCTPVVNNYRLAHLNSPNDLIVTSNGNILFTDPTYGFAQSWPGVGPPELPTATYLFNSKTKALAMLDDTVLQPNGLALSADEKTLYIADSNSTSGFPIGVWGESVRSVYAFDFDEKNLKLNNRRLIHTVERGWPDGLRVTHMPDGRELVLVASMGGPDVVDASGGGAGRMLGKFNVGDDIIFNLEPVKGKSARGGSKKEDNVWLLTGMKAIYKVTFAAG